jgi:hypothetical protein
LIDNYYQGQLVNTGDKWAAYLNYAMQGDDLSALLEVVEREFGD